MAYKWEKKDYSEKSKIKEILLSQILVYRRNHGIVEIPEVYEEHVAAAGIRPEEQRAIEELKQKLESNKYP